jgi:peptide/nickel transport system permease protein
MLAYTLRRLLIAIPVFIGITIIAWGIATTNPDGGAINSYLGRGGGKHITKEQLQAIEHQIGLDKPVPVRYIIWVRNLFQGNLGNSVVLGESVGQAIKEHIGPTLLLAISSLILGELIAIPLGIFSALKRGSVPEQIATIIVYGLYALPTFWFGLMAIVIFGVQLGWFPFGGMVDEYKVGTSFGTAAYWTYFHQSTASAITDLIRHMILPVAVLTGVGLAGDSRLMRASMLNVLDQDYIRTAKAKGLSNQLVIGKHALRNAIMPIVTSIGLQIPYLAGGAIITETIFSWPGMGRLFVQAATESDYPIVIAFIVITGGLTVLFNLITELVYAAVDPRISYS